MLNLCRLLICNHRYMYLCKDSRRFAGHSKWANIKHIKGLKDSEKSATFTKMGRLIRVAIQGKINKSTKGREKDGFIIQIELIQKQEKTSHVSVNFNVLEITNELCKCADPNLNIKLAQVIEKAKRFNMPAASIQNVIKLCKDSKTESKPSLVDLKGPGGSVILVSLVTDNFTKSKQTLNTLVRKSKLTFSNGGWHHLFSYKGIIEVALLQNSSLEEALNHALDVGADDILEVNNNDEKCVQFMCEPGQLQAVKTKLEELKYIIRSADCEYIPNIHVALSDSDLESINYLYKKLQENPDVVNIYDNIAWDNCS